MTTKVFVPQVPSHFDHALRAWIPKINLKHAEEFGQVITVLPPDGGRLTPADAVRCVRAAMKDFAPGDFIVGLGDPAIIALCAAEAADLGEGILKILRWDRIQSRYFPVEFNL